MASSETSLPVLTRKALVVHDTVPYPGFEQPVFPRDGLSYNWTLMFSFPEFPRRKA